MILYGFGDHGNVVYDCLEEKQPFKGYFDQREQGLADAYLGVYDPTILPDEPILISIGDNAIRKKMAAIVQHRYEILIAPSAIVSKRVTIGEGTVILQSTVVQSGVILGQHVIVNAGAIIDHGSNIADFVHLAQGAIICGHCEIGEGTRIGPGAIIHTGVRIGPWQLIQPGEVVTANRP